MPGQPASEPALVFGRFELQRGRKRLLENGVPVHMGSRAFDLLAVLTARAGEIVSRADLVAHVWPCTVVEDSSLRVHMSALRKVLGEGRDGAHYIVNVPGRGYRFVMPVTAAALCEAPLPALEQAPALAGWASPLSHAEPAAAASWAAALVIRPPAVSSASVVAAPMPRPAAPAQARISTSSNSGDHAEPSPLIGRAGVLALLAARLDSYRLVTITGAGGMGKSRVALALAALCAGRYADGVHVIDLADLSTAAPLAGLLADALGVHAAGGNGWPAIATALRARRVLIVLDNCEHLIDAAAELAARALAAGPGVQVVATSREPLDVNGESVYRLPGLATPPATAGAVPAPFFPAVQLFVARCEQASRAQSNSLDDAQIGHLCRQLDGMPLAIELAAACVPFIGAQALLERVNDMFSLFKRGRRTAAPRQRSLQALLDWSYEPLPEAERTVLRRLSVFRASFTLAAAAEVAACARIDADAVVECLRALAAKSLLMAVPAGAGIRHRLLLTTRCYAGAQLRESGEESAVARRHAQRTLATLERGQRNQSTLSAADWLVIHGDSVDDVRAALDWACGPDGDNDGSLVLAVAGSAQMIGSLLLDEYRDRLELVLTRLVAGATGARALELRAALGHITGGARHAVDAATLHPLDLGSRADDSEAALSALYGVAIGALVRGDSLQSLHAASSISDLAQPGDESIGVMVADRLRALNFHYLGQHARAKPLIARVLACAVPAPAACFTAVPSAVSMRILLARMLWIEGFSDKARAAADDVVQRAEAHGVAALCQALAMAALPIALWCGDDRHAAALLARLAAMSDGFALGYWQGWVDGFARVLTWRAGAGAGANARAPAAVNAIVGDLMATLEELPCDAGTVARSSSGAVGWCAPEVMRVHALTVLAGGGADAQAEAETLLQNALQMARAQGALGWQLRVALSLARLMADDGRVTAAYGLLAPAVTAIDGGAATADLRAANALLRRLRPGQPARMGATSDV